jgi:hypothetical protein
MTRRRCSHIDGIHIWIVNQFLGIGVPFTDTVLYGIATGMILCTTHHSHYAGALYFTECRATFLLGHLAASDESPL